MTGLYVQPLPHVSRSRGQDHGCNGHADRMGIRFGPGFWHFPPACPGSSRTAQHILCAIPDMGQTECLETEHHQDVRVPAICAAIPNRHARTDPPEPAARASGQQAVQRPTVTCPDRRQSHHTVPCDPD